MKLQTSTSAKPAVYVETSVVSYLAARTSSDLVISAHQLITRQWWTDASARYDLCTSALVYDEAQNGKPTLAAKRLELLDTMRTLEPSPLIVDISRALIMIRKRNIGSNFTN